MEARAAVAHKAGEPLSIETVQVGGPREGECLVEINNRYIWRCDWRSPALYHGAFR